MGIIQLLVLILVIGFVMWAIVWLLGPYIEPAILEIAKKVAIIGVIALVLFWVLGLFGLVPPLELWKPPAWK